MKQGLVVTSISAPNDCLGALAHGAMAAGIDFILVGDEKSPREFELEGCRFVDLESQLATGFEFALRCPRNHYARKNIGYLIAVREGAEIIIETDDDCHPHADFFQKRPRYINAELVSGTSWANPYAYFTNDPVWPRGLPLNAVRVEPPPPRPAAEKLDCPIQQGLVEEDPDVDAIYRLVVGTPVKFRRGYRIALAPGTAAPFNSQNTSWWRDAFALLYLPATCSFRLTDIYRSFVAQRIAWLNDWRIVFHSPTVFQDRNEHDLMQDFADEVAGYLRNDELVAALKGVDLEPGVERIPENMRTCYAKMSRLGLVESDELGLLDAWISDVKGLGLPCHTHQERRDG